MLVRCQHCGAPLEVGEGRKPVVKCAYCGTANQVATVPHEPTPKGWKPPRTWQPPANVPADSSKALKYAAQAVGRTIRFVVGTVMFFVLVPLGLFVAHRVQSGDLTNAGDLASSLKGLKDLDGLKKKAKELTDLAKPRFIWDSVGGLPVVVEIGGKEAVLGRVRMAGDQLFIRATDSETAAELYRVGPFGTYSEGYRATEFRVTDNTLAVTDFRARLGLYDLKTGKEKKRLPLTDKVKALCVDQKNERFFVIQADKKRLAVDAQTGKTEQGQPPPGCTARKRKRGTTTKGAPRVAGVAPKNVLKDGNLGILEAVKSPGTPHRKVIGFEPKTRKVRFEEWVAQVDRNLVDDSEGASALGFGRYAAVYKVGTDTWHATALNAKSGERLWDVKLRSLFAVDRIQHIVVGEGYVYIERTSSLDILDAKTGELKGAIGNEHYD